MYHTCIFCSKALGSNEVIEHFPVGSRLAFDAFKGRLWAICPRCTRWNLAPVEERWEAVEEAEKQFRDSRLRVQSENIGMAKLRDGTRLVRIGAALPGELAVWRYGTQLVKRRTRMYWMTGAGIAGSIGIMAGLPYIAGVGIPFSLAHGLINTSRLVAQTRAQNRVVLNVDAHESPTGSPLLLRRRHIANAQLNEVDGDISLSVPQVPERQPWYRFQPQSGDQYGERIVLSGAQARLVSARAMVDHNARGATTNEVNAALRLLHEAGSADAYLLKLARRRPTIIAPTQTQSIAGEAARSTTRKVLGTFRGERIPVRKAGIGMLENLLPRTDALALEMALHEESERRAMEGELELLEDAWREAEQIARIADALPGEPPE